MTRPIPNEGSITEGTISSTVNPKQTKNQSTVSTDRNTIKTVIISYNE